MDKSTTQNKIEIWSPPEEVAMADDWYHYASPDHFWIKSRFRAINDDELSPMLLGKQFLEIGCGNGIVINHFEETFNATVDGCDLNMHALTQVSETKGRLFYLNILEKPSQLLGAYDGILLLDVIEHIDDDIEFLRTCTSYLKDGGMVIINVPALGSLFSRYDLEAGHKRRYTKASMRNLLKKCKITEIEIRYWGLTLLPVAFLRKFMLRFVARDRVISVGFKPSNKVINWLFDVMLTLEHKISKSPFLGTSLVAIGKVEAAAPDN